MTSEDKGIYTMEDTMAQKLWDELREKGYSDERIEEIFERQKRMPLFTREPTYDANKTILNEISYMKDELYQELEKRNYPEEKIIEIVSKFYESYLDKDLLLRVNAKVLPSFSKILKDVLEKGKV